MSDSIEQRLALVFLERFWADKEAGKELGIADYIALFPGHDEMIAREYLGALAESRGDAEHWMTAEDSATEEDRLGPYLLLQELGRGGQGVVWLAEDTRLGRQVAIKVLTGLGPGAESHLARFKREAALASKLEHPGICGVYDTGIEGGVPYIAMRYVKGETLADRLSSLRSKSTEDAPSSFMSFDDEEEDAPEAPTNSAGPSSATSIDRGELDRVITAFEKIASALHAAHEVGIVHRDIKPGNIMVSEADDQPVILDFGLARDDSDDAGPSLTQTGDLFGTPAYMSPEQITGRRVRLDRRTDIYSLGVTLYECLTLKRPFEAPTRESLYQAILSKEPEGVRNLNRLISGDLEVVVQCTLDKDRDRRYQTAADLAEDLRRVRAGEPILAKKVSAVGRAWRWSKRRPTAAALLMALAFGIPTISGLGVWWWTHRDDVAAQEQARIDELVEDQLEIGFSELHHGSKIKAAAAFEEALRINAGSAEATAGLVLTYSYLDRLEAALRYVERAESLVAQPGILGRTKATVLHSLGREAEAAVARQAAPRIATSATWFIRGVLLQSKAHDLGEDTPEGRLAFEEAASMLARAVATSQRPRRAYHFLLAHVRGHIADTTAALVTADAIETLWPRSARGWYWIGFVTVKADPNRSVAAFREAVRLEPLHAPSHVNLGVRLADRGDLRGAEATLRAAIRLDPLLVEAHSNLGSVLLEQGHLDEALAACRAAIRLDSGHALTHDRLGLVLQGQGHLDAAIKAHGESIELDPNSASAHSNLSTALKLQGRFEDAVAALGTAIELEPENAAYYSNLGSTLAAMGKHDDARKAYFNAIELDPEYAQAHYNLGVDLVVRGRFDEAVAAYREAVRCDPKWAPTHGNLAILLHNLGRLDEAEAACREGILHHPESAKVHNTLGSVLKGQGHLDKAAAAFRESARLDSKYAVAHANLGMVLQLQGSHDDAVVAYRRAINLDPELVDPLFNLGNLLWRELGERAEGLALIRRGHELSMKRGKSRENPSGSWLQDAVAARARELRKEGDWEAVVALLEEYTKAYPELESLPEMLELSRRRLEAKKERDGGG